MGSRRAELNKRKANAEISHKLETSVKKKRKDKGNDSPCAQGQTTSLGKAVYP